MITGLEYRISTTLSSLGLPHWIQYGTAPGREGIPGHLLTQGSCIIGLSFKIN